MASMNLSIAFVLLLSALVVFGDIGRTAAAEAPCAVRCIQGGYITCDNYPPGKQLDGCACECAPKNGKNCVLHLDSGSKSNCPAQVQRLD